MSKMTKKVLIILLSVILMGLLTIIPGFCETQDNLKRVFVTREEWTIWKNNMSQALATLEGAMQEAVQSKTKVEMTKRGINESSSESASDGS